MSQPLSGAFLQSVGWERFQQALGHETVRVPVVGDSLGALCVRAPLPFGSKVSCVRYGESATPHLFETLTRGVSETWKDPLFFQWEPLNGPDLTQKQPLQPPWTFFTPIQATYEAQIALMHQKTRYNIRTADRARIVVDLNASFDDEVWGLFKETSKRGGFHLHPRRYYQIFSEQPGSDIRIFVATARYQEKMAAVTIMVDHGSMRTYLHGASSHDLRAHMAPYALHARLLEDAMHKGCEWYDWWGVAPKTAGEDHHWAGITRFKIRFGGEYHQLPGASSTILRPLPFQAYRVLRAVRRRLR